MSLSIVRSALYGAMALLAISTPALAQTNLAPAGVISGDSPGPVDGFGASVASYQNWLFIGAPRERSSRNQMDGAVYIYRRLASGGYQFVQKIPGTQTAAAGGDRFGAGVLATDGWLFVAVANNQDFPGLIDPRDDPGDGVAPFFFAGKVLVYRLQGGNSGTWVFAQALTSPQPGSNGSFGTRTQSNHMALTDNADLIAIGEPGNYDNATGRMHVFARQGQTWSLQQSISVATDSAEIDYFAADSIVSLPGDRFAVEVRRVLASGANQGQIYVYTRSGNQIAPNPVQIVSGDSYNAGDCDLDGGPLGGMAAGGRVFAMTHPCANGAAGARVGRLDIYAYNRGANATPLTPETSIEGTIPNGLLGSTLFGGQESVSVDNQGQQILVGATGGSFGDPEARGADVLLYRRQGNSPWQLHAKLQPTVNAPFRAFGQAVVFGHQGTGLGFVGEFSAAADAASAPSKGAVLFYSLPGN